MELGRYPVLECLRSKLRASIVPHERNVLLNSIGLRHFLLVLVQLVHLLVLLLDHQAVEVDLLCIVLLLEVILRYSLMNW